MESYILSLKKFLEKVKLYSGFPGKMNFQICGNPERYTWLKLTNNIRQKSLKFIVFLFYTFPCIPVYTNIHGLYSP